MEMLSRNFKRSELACPCCDRCEMRPEFMTRLQALRDIVGFPLVITSGYRCERHNKEVGGVRNSQHLIGNAVDISISRMDAGHRFILLKAVLDLGWRGLGIGRTYLHVDARTHCPVCWLC